MKKHIKIIVILSILTISMLSAVLVLATTYQNDERGRISEIKLDSGETAKISYDAKGRITNIVFSHDTIESNGILSASINGVYRNETARDILEARIVFAKGLRDETHESNNGANVPTSEFWATPSVFYEFNKAINSTQAFLDFVDSEKATNVFARGESFDMVVRIDGNKGFANMMIKMFIPQGLELTGYSYSGFPWFNNNIISPTIPTIGSNFALFGWQGRTSNITGDSDLFTFTFKVSNNAALGLTESITMSFENAPINANNDEVEISFCPYGIAEKSDITVIGGIIITDI